MTLQANPELVLFMDTCTGEIKIEKVASESELISSVSCTTLQFRTGLAHNSTLAAKIRVSLDRRGVKFNGVKGKCVNLSKDWLVQILTIIYNTLSTYDISERLAILTQIADNNGEWRVNPGIKVQREKALEYWNKVEAYSRAKVTKAEVEVESEVQLNQPTKRGLKILIVEDEALSMEIMLYHFSPLGKCDVATNGLEAIEAFMMSNSSGESYDLITLDIMMPKMNGREALKLIRSMEEWRGLVPAKIIMTTSMDDAKDIMTAFKEQCDAYLVKPISRKALKKLLCELSLIDDCEM